MVVSQTTDFGLNETRTMDFGFRTKLRLLSCFGAVVLALGLAGCAGPFKQVNFEVRESYRSEKLNPRGLRWTRVALLTASVGTGQEEYKRLTGDLLEKAFNRFRRDIVVIPSGEALSRINNADLTDGYAWMIRDYATTGILNKETLGKVGNALGVRHVIQPRLVKFKESQETRFSIFGLTLVKTQESSFKAFLEVWDTETGEILWEGSGEATVAVEDVRAKPISFEEVAAVAFENLVKKLP